MAKARSWVSRTPFLPTRHPKRTRANVPKVDATGFQIGSPEHELLRLLELGGFPEPEAVEPVRCTRLGERDVPWSAFVRRRKMDERSPAANGAGYRLMHRICGAGAGSSGGGVCEPLWDGGIFGEVD